MFKRKLNIAETLKDLSVLLLGPRQTGKTTLIGTSLKNPIIFDLLDPELFRDLQKSPNSLKDLVKPIENSIIVIDEIQKLPELLDIVQSLMNSKNNNRFVLTGSSARKLRRQGQNLLGGRAFPLFLHPITSQEFLLSNKENDLHKLIELGGLPQVLLSPNPQRLLKAYVGIYLQEEIKAEGLARNLGDFSKFLDVAGLTNGEQTDYAGISRDVQLSARTVASYYLILQDTLVGYLLESFKMTKVRKAVTTPKFYFFDVGISNYLCGREKLAVGTLEYGRALEHFIFTELIAYRDYLGKDFELFYWRSTSQFEVDFIIKTKTKKLIGIEVKATNRIDKDDLKGLRAFEEDFKLDKKIVVCREKNHRTIEDSFEVMPYQEFLKKLWAQDLF